MLIRLHIDQNCPLILRCQALLQTTVRAPAASLQKLGAEDTGIRQYLTLPPTWEHTQPAGEAQRRKPNSTFWEPQPRVEGGGRAPSRECSRRRCNNLYFSGNPASLMTGERFAPAEIAASLPQSNSRQFSVKKKFLSHPILYLDNFSKCVSHMNT